MSTSEDKYRVVSNAVCKILWVSSLLTELDVELSTIPIIWCDNTRVIALTENLIQHSKTMDMELDLFLSGKKFKMILCILLIK